MTDAPYQALITGSNRGIGIEFVRQYAGAGYRVIACYPLSLENGGRFVAYDGEEIPW